MKKYTIYHLVFLILSTASFAQVGVGTTSPLASSALDVTATNKGLLVPRVALTGSTDTATITLPATSLLVYNTATAGTSPNNVTPGYYYYTGTQWERLTNGGANSVGAFTSATANGATITGGALQLAPASLTTGGIVTTGAQTFDGTKTFSVDAIVNGLTVGKGPGNGTNNVSNTAIGIEALSGITDWTGYPADYNMANTGAIDNVAVGNQVLKRTTTGTANTGVGKEALTYNTTGDENTALGMIALLSNTTGDQNTAVGKSSMQNNLTGSQNTAIGVTSLHANTSGSFNTAIGLSALLLTTTGVQNTAVGNSAGSNITTGNNNVAIGYLAGPTTGGISNSIAIGAGTTLGASNMIRLGNGAITVIQGQVGFSASSDIRLKQDISNTKYGLNTIMQLRPVDYTLKSNQLKQVGFIAQEVQKLIPEVVTGVEGDLEKGETLGITYANMVPILTKAIQELKKENELQEIEINQLKELVNKLVNKK
jgi:hypothetical protein